MSILNAISRLNTKSVHNETKQQSSSSSVSTAPQELAESAETDEFPENFEVSRKFELGEIVSKVAGKAWTAVFYVTITIYLYGDLSIYAAAVPKSLRDVSCRSLYNDSSVINEYSPCWPNGSFSRMNVYRVYLAGFALLLGPFFFFNVTRTSWLQIFTSIMRWAAFILMIALACERISHFPRKLAAPPHIVTNTTTTTPISVPHPPAANFHMMASLFGVSVYSFMCHHSLPGLITPVHNKHHLYSTLLLPAYIVVLLLYLLLVGTAVAAFDTIEDLYTLNFVPSGDPDAHTTPFILTVDYFLSLFPVFALSSTFPIVGTTLSNNLFALISLLMPQNPYRALSDSPRRMDARRLAIRVGVPLVTLLPPVAIAFATNDIEFLVGVTGAFGGSGIQYVFPTVLVYYARQELARRLKSKDVVGVTEGDDEGTAAGPSSAEEAASESVPLLSLRRPMRAGSQNPFASPFAQTFWLVLMIVWASVCVLVVLLHRINLF
uniref:Transmembrane protein 104 homolog n=3 Tax=Schistocephalus solidus TaxID=70667 RepID=A0A0V0J3U8_SCHSO